MPRTQFVIRGQTASGETEVLNFSGRTPGYGYKMTEFQLYGSTAIGGSDFEIMATVTAGKVGVAPGDPNFNDEALIATSFAKIPSAANYPAFTNYTIVNDTFIITQDLILMVLDSNNSPVNWQCRFKKVGLTTSAEAVANFKQFTLSS